MLTLHNSTLRLLLAVACVACAAPAAEAQIYSWRDASGTLVLSDRPLHPTAQTFAVGRAATVRTTRPALHPNAGRYDGLITQHATSQGIRADLVRAVIQVESGYNRLARSHKGAIGLMQLMPETAADLDVADAYDPAENIRGGVTYLKSLLTRYDGNEELALAAYNAGPAAVERYGNRVPPYRETRAYVSRIQTSTDLRRAGGDTIYKTVDVIEGREVPRYSNVKPASGDYQIAARPR